MKVEGSYIFEVPPEIVWPMLLDPDVLTNIMPGCEKFEQIGVNDFEGTAKLKVGPVQGSFKCKITLTNVDAPKGYNMEYIAKGAAGWVSGEGKLWLESENSHTTLYYQGDADINGKIASVGQRLMDAYARAIIRQSLEGFSQLIAAQQQAEKDHALIPKAAGDDQIIKIASATVIKPALRVTQTGTNLVELSQLIRRHYDLSEFKSLCFELQVAYDDLPGETLTNRVEALVEYLQRRGRVQELLKLIKQQRPNAT